MVWCMCTVVSNLCKMSKLKISHPGDLYICDPAVFEQLT